MIPRSRGIALRLRLVCCLAFCLFVDSATLRFQALALCDESLLPLLLQAVGIPTERLLGSLLDRLAELLLLLVPCHLHLLIDVGSVLPKGGAEQANRPSDLVRLLGPLFPATVARWGADLLLGGECNTTLRPEDTKLGVEADAPLDDGDGPGVLGNDMPVQLASPDKNLDTRLLRRIASG